MNTPPILRDKIAQSLRFDSLHEAEELTGKSYKDDATTEALGFLMHLQHVQNKAALLELAGDTHYSLAWTDFRAMLPKIGFEAMFVEVFKDEDGNNEEAICAWNARRGALLWAESYHLNYRWDDPEYAAKYPPGVNSGNVYFQWEPTTDEWWLEGASHGPVGGPNSKVRHANYDIREGLVHHLTMAEDKGRFIKPWVEMPFMWLLTYMDTKTPGYDHEAITAARLAKLPVTVREIIGA